MEKRFLHSPPREVIYDYLKGYLNSVKIKETEKTAVSWIRFNTSIRKVDYNTDTQEFLVESYDYTKDQTIKETFQKVIVATGHFSRPNYPNIPGSESFKGNIIHSHEFKGTSSFKSKRILLVGGSLTAEDLASLFFKEGDYDITISHRKPKPLGYKWPKNISEKPIVTSIDKSSVFFADGSSKEVDQIILCTGYNYDFHFMADDLKLKCKKELYVDDLFYGIIFKNNINLFYIAMQYQLYTLPMIQPQSWLIRDIILGKYKLPSKEELVKDLAEWRVNWLQRSRRY